MLVLVGKAQAGGQRQAWGELVIALPVQRVAFGIGGAVLAAGVDPVLRHRKGQAVALGAEALLVQVHAEGVAEPVVFAVELEFLGGVALLVGDQVVLDR